MHLNGNIKITNGTQGANKVLTSDVSGLALWKILSLEGYEIKTTSGYYKVTANCSASKKVIGGGCQYDGNFNGTSLISSYPATGSTGGWVCTATTDDLPTTAYAICAN